MRRELSLVSRSKSRGGFLASRGGLVRGISVGYSQVRIVLAGLQHWHALISSQGGHTFPCRYLAILNSADLTVLLQVHYLLSQVFNLLIEHVPFTHQSINLSSLSLNDPLLILNDLTFFKLRRLLS
jgi:hypothetical protein